MTEAYEFKCVDLVSEPQSNSVRYTCIFVAYVINFFSAFLMAITWSCVLYCIPSCLGDLGNEV